MFNVRCCNLNFTLHSPHSHYCLFHHSSQAPVEPMPSSDPAPNPAPLQQRSPRQPQARSHHPATASSQLHSRASHPDDDKHGSYISDKSNNAQLSHSPPCTHTPLPCLLESSVPLAEQCSCSCKAHHPTSYTYRNGTQYASAARPAQCVPPTPHRRSDTRPSRHRPRRPACAAWAQTVPRP